MNIRSKVLKNRNIPSSGNLLGKVCSKPYGIIIIGIMMGTILLSNEHYISGIVILFLFSYYLFFVRNLKLIEFYDQYAVFYLHNGKDECYVLFWEDIESWMILSKWNDTDKLKVVLKNHEIITLNCIGKKKIKKYFLTYSKMHENISENKNIKQYVK